MKVTCFNCGTENECQSADEVAFGPDPSDRLTVEWASRGLTWLKANRPKVFADMMTVGVFGIAKTPGR